MSLGPHRSSLPRVLVLLVVAVASWIWIDRAERPARMLSVPRAQRAHVEPDRTDEPEWVAISIAHVRQLLFGEGPPGDAGRGANPWRRGVQSSTFGAANPCLAKLLWGMTAVAAGQQNMPPTVFQKYHGQRPEVAVAAWRETEPAMPAMRCWVVAFAAGSALLLFFCASVLGGLVPGILAWAAWCSSPLVQTWSHYIRPDLLMVTLALATLAAVLAWQRTLAGGRGASAQVAAIGALGVLAGLCVSSKLNGVVACVFVALAVPLVAHLGRAPEAKLKLVPLLAGLFLAACATVTVVYALHPVLWRDPLGEGQKILTFWDKHMQFQRERWQGLGGRGAADFGERLALVWDRALGRDEPLRAVFGIVGGWIAVALGMLMLAVRAWRCDPVERARAAAVLTWIVVVALVTTAWLPLDWDRYYFVFVACMALAEAALVGSTMSWARARLKRA